MYQPEVGIKLPPKSDIPPMLEKIALKTGLTINKLIVIAIRERLHKDGYLKTE